MQRRQQQVGAGTQADTQTHTHTPVGQLSLRLPLRVAASCASASHRPAQRLEMREDDNFIALNGADELSWATQMLPDELILFLQSDR